MMKEGYLNQIEMALSYYVLEFILQAIYCMDDINVNKV